MDRIEAYRIWVEWRKGCSSKFVGCLFSSRPCYSVTDVFGHLHRKDILSNFPNTLLYRSTPAKYRSTRIRSLEPIFIMSSDPLFYTIEPAIHIHPLHLFSAHQNLTKLSPPIRSSFFKSIAISTFNGLSTSGYDRR